MLLTAWRAEQATGGTQALTPCPQGPQYCPTKQVSQGQLLGSHNSCASQEATLCKDDSMAEPWDSSNFCREGSEELCSSQSNSPVALRLLKAPPACPGWP